MEDNINGAYYEAMFRFFLKTMGAVNVQTMTPQILVPELNSKVKCVIADSCLCRRPRVISFLQRDVCYDEIDRILDKTEFDKVNRKTRKTAKEKLSIKRYEFDNMLIRNPDGPLAQVFEWMSATSQNRRYFLNAVAEFTSTPKAELVKRLRKHIVRRADIKAATSAGRHAGATASAGSEEQCRLRHRHPPLSSGGESRYHQGNRGEIFFLESFDETQCTLNVPSVSVPQKCLQAAAMKIRKNLSGNGSKKPGVEGLVETLQPVFTHWTGSSFSRDKETTKRVRGKQTSDYCLK